jgi:hypothetical protein
MITEPEMLLFRAIRRRRRRAILDSATDHAGAGRSLSTRAAEGERPVQRLKA